MKVKVTAKGNFQITLKPAEANVLAHAYCMVSGDTNREFCVLENRDEAVKNLLSTLRDAFDAAEVVCV